MGADQPAAGGGTSRGLFQEALSLHRQGSLSEAEQRYRQILASDRGHFEALIHLGLIRLQAGSRDEALGLFQEALDRNPDSADAHAGLANALLARGDLDGAASCYRKALALDPGHAEANYGLAAALQALNRHEEAVPYYENALTIDPDYAEASYGLGAALQALNRHEEAIPYYENALAIDPDYAEASYGLGTALQALGRDEPAIRAYEKAIAAKPDFADAHNNLGVAWQQLGRFEEARLAFERALALAPDSIAFYSNLFEIKKATKEDRHFAALQALAQREAALSRDDRIRLHFALGKALADTGEHCRSFRHLLVGNALKRQEIVYDERAAQNMFDRIRAVFSAGLMAAKGGQGDPSSLPIFILGMPRSGSTLVEQILAGHPKVFAAGERLDLRDALNDFGKKDGTALPFPERFLVATSEELRRLGADYLVRLKTALPGSAACPQRITDKMPANFRLVGLIHLALPNARIIHTCRDPVDTCLSCFSILFNADQPFAYDLGELGRYYRAYSALMQHWRQVLPRGVMLDVRYEELIADFAPQARRILAHCGLEWDERCLAFDKTARPVRTASSYQVRQPLYRSSIGRPRPDPELLRPLLEGLGPDLAGA